MQDWNEELLDAWLNLSTVINNEKLVSDMPYNEALICNILYRNQMQQDAQPLTATDLCGKTRILKSQMNRTLNSMEEKGLIARERSGKDRRQVLIRMDERKMQLYEKQHEKILKLVDALAEKVGRDRVPEIVELFTLISNIAEEVIKG